MGRLPRRSSGLDALLKYWPLAVAVGTIVGALLTFQQQRDAVMSEADRQCQRIAQMESLFVSEFPGYTQAIFYRGAPVCK